ncbi:MAG: formate dehydrogenase subunit gamma [bacterium]
MDNPILRMKTHEIIIHWFHLLFFMILLITGLLLFVPRFLPFWGEIVKGTIWTKKVHHICAFPFMFILPFMAWMFWKPCKWEEGDFTWITRGGGYIGHLFKNVPEAGEFNAGQKLFYYFTVLSGIVFTISGIIMWQAHSMPPALVRWMYVAHDCAMLLVVLFFVAHVYLSSIGAPGSIQLLFNGKVSHKWARLHHPRWYKELKKKGLI